MVFNRKLHKLPKFPADVIPIFEGCCMNLPEEEIPALLQEYRDMCQKRYEETKNNALFDKRLALEIQDRCEQLLEVYSQVHPGLRKLIIGAVRYCAAVRDGFSEDFFASGLRDDAKVVNYVLEEIGVEDAFIDLRE